MLTSRFLVPALLAGLALATAVPVFAVHIGGGTTKVSLCHKGHTITVGAPAVPAHLQHGDTRDPCGSTPTTTATATATSTAEATATETPGPTATETVEATETIEATATETIEPTATEAPTETPTPGTTAAQGVSSLPDDGTVVCHHGHSMNIHAQSVAAHLSHGDTIGPC